jgi:curved DNA-binding protein CbpA
MKNYYEILEVNPKASKEIIEKAYRVLIKKYHPDLYEREKKQYAEQKTKDINEAYKILSDEFLREQYDSELEKQESRYQKNNYQIPQNQNTGRPNNNQARQKTETTAEQPIKKPKVGSFGAIVELTKGLIYDLVRSKEKREELKDTTEKNVLAVILTIIVVIFIGVILWFVPFTNGWMRELLFENPLFNAIGKIFSK